MLHFQYTKAKSGPIQIYDYIILVLTPLFLLIPLLPYLVKIWGSYGLHGKPKTRQEVQ